MRGFLIFLALATPVVLASPVFWWLVESEVGAAQSTIVEADGAVRNTYLGPRSPWPAWVVTPAGAKRTVRSYYSAAPGHAAAGYAELDYRSDARTELAALTQRLVAEGWTVTTARLDTLDPSLPPQPLTLCTLAAERTDNGGRTLRYGFQLTPQSRTGRVHWAEGPPLPGWVVPDGPAC